MSERAGRSNVSEVVERLRARVLAAPAGAALGSEEAIEQALGVSRPTIRQAARILEREGLLSVRRGNNGGYFGARPDAGFIEAAVASYLETLDARSPDLARVATALWVETVREAAAGGQRGEFPAASLRRAVTRLPADAGFSAVQALEQRIRSAVFAHVGSAYVELIFNINARFARRRMAEVPGADDDTARHRDFVSAWRQGMVLLIDAIAAGDVEIAVLAASRSRRLLHERIWPAD